MQRPNPGELLHGLRQSLAEQVLPAVPKGVPYQQMKAALHLLGRLERSWDLVASHLAKDNADIEQVLTGLLPPDGPQSLENRISMVEAPVPVGYNDPALREAAQRNFALHQLLLDQPYNSQIAALHLRMSSRDSRYVGDSEDQRNFQG